MDQKPRVLVAGMSESVRAEIARRFAGLPADVDAVPDAREAFGLIIESQSSRHSLVIAGVHVPPANGFDFLANLKNQSGKFGWVSTIPVILVAPDDNLTPQSERARRMGAFALFHEEAFLDDMEWGAMTTLMKDVIDELGRRHG